MIPRIAEQSFWTFRYLERGEILTRMLLSLHLKGLDNHILSPKKEAILLHLWVGTPLFSQLWKGKESDYELIQHFLSWEKLNPSSLFSSFACARTNARLIREILNEEVWLAINELHLWLNDQNTQHLYNNNRPTFFKRILSTLQKIKGIFYSASRRDDYYQMMEMGCMLERTNQVSNMLLKLIWEPFYSLQNDTYSEDRLDKQFGLLSFLLNCFDSTENYLQSEQTYTPTSFIKFFIQDSFSPYSMQFCLKNCMHNLFTLKHQNPHLSTLAYFQIENLLAHLSQLVPEKLLSANSFEEHSFISIHLNDINDSLQTQIFHPKDAIKKEP